MRHVAFALLFTLVTTAADDPVQVVPRPVSPKWTEVKADADGRAWLSVGEKAAAEWELVDRAGATLDVPPGSTVAVFSAVRPGAYRVVAVAEGKLVRCVVLVGDVPPPPKPGPPDPPAPVDELVAKLQAAYKLETGATKAQDLKQLIALYLEASDFAKKSDFATAEQLFTAVAAAAAALLPDDPATGARRLGGLRKAISTDLVAVLPTDPAAALTDEVRAQASAAFARYAKALGGVAP